MYIVTSTLSHFDSFVKLSVLVLHACTDSCELGSTLLIAPCEHDTIFNPFLGAQVSG